MALDYKSKGDVIKAEDWNSLVASAKGEQDPSQGGFTKTRNGVLFTQDHYYTRPKSSNLPEALLQVRDVEGPKLLTRNYEYDTTEITRSVDILLGADLSSTTEALNVDLIFFQNIKNEDYKSCNSMLSSIEFDIEKNENKSKLSVAGGSIYNDGWIPTGIQCPLSVQIETIYGTFIEANISSTPKNDEYLSALSGVRDALVISDGNISSVLSTDTMKLFTDNKLQLVAQPEIKNEFIIAKNTKPIEKTGAAQRVQITLGSAPSPQKSYGEPWDIEGGQFKRAYWQIGCVQGECNNVSSYVLDYADLSTVYCTMDLVNISAMITDQEVDDPGHYSAPIITVKDDKISYVNRHPVAPVWGNYII